MNCKKFHNVSFLSNLWFCRIHSFASSHIQADNHVNYSWSSRYEKYHNNKKIQYLILVIRVRLNITAYNFHFISDRTTKDYGRNAKEIGRGSAVPGPWPGRSPGLYFAIASSILVATISSFLVGSKASKQLYFSGGGNCVSQFKLL